MIKLQLNRKDLAFLKQNMQRFSEDINEIVRIELGLTANDIRNDAINSAPVAFGQLQKQIIVDENAKGFKVESGSKYSAYVEFGTKSKVDVPPELASIAMKFKGGAPGTWDELLKNIEEWAHKTKKIPIEAAYGAAMNIARYGVKAQPFLYPAYTKNRDLAEKNINRKLKDFVKTKNYGK